MKHSNIEAPAFIREAVKSVISDLLSMVDMIDAENGKPMLNSVTKKKLSIIVPVTNAIFAGKKISVADQIKVLNCVHVSEAMTAKLEDVNALSSACCCNPVCKARAKDCNSICSHCFAFDTLHRYDGTKQATMINFIILNAMVYSKSAWKAINIPASKCFDLFRIEAFGDVASAVQAGNYINLAYTHKYIEKVGVWSKNLGFWAVAYETLGKPSNMVFNASSPVMNQPMAINPRFDWFVDHVFTVYDCKHAIAGNININCGEKVCKDCKRCYTKGNGRNVNEILKAESRRYYKAIGKPFKGRGKKA